MDPARSSIGGGVAAMVVLAVYLFVADLLVGATDGFVFSTVAGLCAVGGPPYCDPGTPSATALSLLGFAVLFAIGWPLLFGGFTWGLPGDSGVVHGAVFGLVLWTGYVVLVVYGIGFGGGAEGALPLAVVSLVGYLLYGVVLGGTYDRLAAHRTFLSQPNS